MSDRVASGCVDAGRMLGLLEGTLPESEQAKLEAHLEGCAACRRAFDAMAAEGRFWDDLRQFAGAGRETTRQADVSDEDEEPVDFLEPDSSPGRIGRFGRYEVLEVLGRGGMGIVLKAFDPGLHRVVAIKVLSPRLATSASARRRFEREARAAASVAHEHVVTIHAVDEAKGLPYLVMQYVAGRSLQQRIDRDGPLDLESILRIGMQTAAGLAAAHAQGLVHRDVKPANILLENGIERVKITDFGLARAVDDASLTQSGVVAGTPQYMAPEQARAETVDHRADLFSLGSVLYAMCTGRSPFRAETTVGVIRRVCDDTPRPIREVNPAVPDWLAGIVAVLHAKDPARRYQSAGEVAGLLGGHLAQLQQPTTAVFPTVAVPVPPPPLLHDLEFNTIPAAKEPSRRGPGCWILLGMLIAIFGLFLAAVVLYFAMGREETPAKGYFYPGRPFLPVPGTELPVRGSEPTGRNPTIDPIRTFTAHAGVVKSLAISSDGRFALSGSGYPSGDMTARLWDLEAGREVHRLTGSLGQVLGVAISPDGRRALTCGEYPTIRLWDVETGHEIRRFPGHHAGGVNAVAFSPDGRRAVSAGSDDALILLWDLETGDVIRQFHGHASRVFSVAYSPGGRYILSGGEDRTVRLWDAETGREVRKLHGPSHSIEAVAFSPDGRLAMAGGHERIVWIWDVETGGRLRVLAGHGGIIVGLAFTPDGRRALSVSPPEGRLGDATMRLWDLETWREVARVEGPDDSGFWSVAVLPDGRRALTGGSDGAIRMWSLPYAGPSPAAGSGRGDGVMPGEVRVLRGHSNSVEAVDASGDGRLAISAGTDHTLRLWELRTGRQIRKLVGHEDEVSGVAISDDGRIAVSGSLDRTIRVWDVESGRSVPLLGHERKVRAVAISRDVYFALSGSEEAEPLYWDLAAGKVLRRLKGHTKGICSVAISPDGRLGLSGSLDGTARLWRLEDGACLLVVGQAGPWVSAVAFMPDGRRIVIGWQDGTLEIHDFAGQTPFHRLAGHRAYIRVLRASLDGRLILSAGGGALRLWDAATGAEVHQLQRVGGGIVCGTILPDSREVLFGCFDSTIRLWRLPASLGGSKPF